MQDSWIEIWDETLHSANPLQVSGYRDRLEEIGHESVRTGRWASHVRIECNFDAFGGSMGAVHGERVVRAFDRATSLRLPVVCITQSGGARMQEGMVSLIQLGRTVGAVRRHAESGLMSVAVLRSPTTGGVWASYASSCALKVAENGALIGFAGPRVVTRMTGEVVGEESHTAETALANGLVDAVVPAEELDDWVEAALGRRAAPPPKRDRTKRPHADAALAELSADGDVWATVNLARSPQRPTGIDIAAQLCDSWLDLASPDRAVRCGLVQIAQSKAVVIASDRFAGDGRPTPKGFRQARRAMAIANRLSIPIVTLIDTPGAAPGAESENDALAMEIAATFSALEGVSVPTMSICVGEGGSGGALALAWCDTLLMQASAIFSVISPEAAAEILYRDHGRASEVAGQLGLTAKRLLELHVIDGIVDDDPVATCEAIRNHLGRIPVGRRRERPDSVTTSALWEAES